MKSANESWTNYFEVKKLIEKARVPSYDADSEKCHKLEHTHVYLSNKW